jgi:hypothetical protein
MSYSFSVSAPNKAEAKRLLAEKFDEVVAAQPVHAHDREIALAAGNAFLDRVVEPAEGHVVIVSLSGSLGWRNVVSPAEDGTSFTSASVSANAYVTAS